MDNKFNLNLIPLDELHGWDVNDDLKIISHDGYERLKSQLRKGQHSTLLVLKDGTVIGGNSRIKAMRELGIKAAKCIILDFLPRGDSFAVTLDGEVQFDPLTKEPVTFPTIEDATMFFAMSHNDEAGYVNRDGLVNLIPEYNLDWSELGANFNENPDVEGWANFSVPGALDDLANIELPSESLDLSSNDKSNEEKSKDETPDGDDAPVKSASPTPEYKEKGLVSCPSCAEVFEVAKHLVKKSS